jgi:curved DNA-binding protein CbpA
MSAPVAGKFQNHYLTLGVDPRSDSDAIQKAYVKLAEKYHPNNTATGNREKFEEVNGAYEVLSNPALRREFDTILGIGQSEGVPKFSGLGFFESFGRDAGVRMALLCILYDRRRSKPFTPSLSMRHIENILDASTEELNFALWYLKQRGLAVTDDKSSLQITVDGMDYLAANTPSAEVVMPLVKKPSAAAPEKPAEPSRPAQVAAPAAPPEPAPAEDSAKGLFGRMLARN